MNEAGMWSKLAHLAGDAVVETQPYTDDQIGCPYGTIDMRRAMHARHT